MYWHPMYFGMHLFWWFFWALLIIGFFSMATPIPRKIARIYREDPLGILKRRYAAGEITGEEYEERKARIERDSASARTQPISRGRFDRNAPA